MPFSGPTDQCFTRVKVYCLKLHITWLSNGTRSHPCRSIRQAYGRQSDRHHQVGGDRFMTHSSWRLVNIESVSHVGGDYFVLVLETGKELSITITSTNGRPFHPSASSQAHFAELCLPMDSLASATAPRMTASSPNEDSTILPPFLAAPRASESTTS